MAGRENVVVEPVEGGNRSAAMLTGRIKGALSGRGFNVLERDAWDIMRRERTLGSASGANIESASVLIKGRIHEHTLDQSVESADFLIVEDGGKKKGGREYTVTRYRTAGVARVETSFDVVDLETSRLLVSTTCRAERRGVTQYGESAQALNESEMMRQCYEEIVDLFMQKIAPFSVQADHALLHIKENIQNENGIALVQAGRHTDAVERFESALNAILNNPSAKPGDKGKILHNRAVALELLGKYEEAISSYYAAMDNNSGPKDATNIARCEERQNDQKKLKEQGVKPTGGGSAP